MRIVVCGGGVIGAALAYELSRQGADVTVIERWRVGGAASGKSGGFLAKDWCDGTPVEALAHRSFALHEAWAESLGDTYGYRKVDTFSAVKSPRTGKAPSVDTRRQMATWLAGDAIHRRQLGNEETTAALDPERFTNALVAAAISHRTSVRIAAMTDVARDGEKVVGVRLANGETIAADSVVLALGPWSLLASKWAPLPPIYGLKGHSLIFKPTRTLPAHAVFAELETADGDIHAPEIVSRADGTVYVCGLPGHDALPVDPARVTTEAGASELLRDIATTLVPDLAGAAIVREQACFRPVTRDGMPIIGPIPGNTGLFVATGHSVWGMLNAPGTAEALAGLILNGTSGGVDLGPFAPDRLEPLDPDTLEMRSG